MLPETKVAIRVGSPELEIVDQPYREFFAQRACQISLGTGVFGRCLAFGWNDRQGESAPPVVNSEVSWRAWFRVCNSNNGWNFRLIAKVARLALRPVRS